MSLHCHEMAIISDKLINFFNPLASVKLTTLFHLCMLFCYLLWNCGQGSSKKSGQMQDSTVLNIRTLYLLVIKSTNDYLPDVIIAERLPRYRLNGVDS